jgi:hypothetical protein
MLMPSLPTRSTVYGTVAWFSALAIDVTSAANIALPVLIGLGILGK